MSNAVMQHSFHAGEWAPALNARVDVAKYKAGAALMRNFYPDYRGGASSRSGTRYILQCFKSNFPVRLFTFKVNFVVNYVLEFGQNYIRPFLNGAPVLEASFNITGASKANPCVLTVTNSYNVGDWIFVSGVGGMTQLNNRYFSVIAVSGTTVTLGDLNGTAINSTFFSTYTTGGITQRVFTIPSPYLGSDLALLKFAQNVNTLVICHPNYQPAVLNINTSSLTTILFGSTIMSPTGLSVTTTLAAGSANYSYLVTAVDSSGQESAPSAPAALASVQDLRAVAGTNTVHWTAAPGAASYNVYRAQISYIPVPAGSQYGFVGNCTGTNFIDSNIAPDFTEGPPIIENPFVGAPVQSVTVTAGGTYSVVPSVTIAAPSSGVQATAAAQVAALQVTSIINGVGTVGDVMNVQLYSGGGFGTGTLSGPIICAVQVTATSGGPSSPITAAVVVPGTSITLAAIPGTLFASPSWVNSTFPAIQVTLNWTVSSVSIVSGGSGYTSVPTVTFSPAGATGTAVLGTASSGNPSVPAYYQQRLILAGPTNNPEQFNMSQTGSYYNFNTNSPVQADDAIQGVLVANSLHTIKSIISMSTGLVILSDQAAWLLNGGSIGSAVTPSSLVANPHSYNGASDVPPIVSNFDILYVQSKGSIVRDLTFNFYAQIYTGTDISILSSHLFYGYQIKEWSFAEEPFKIIWAVRNDGTLLSLTFLKEQDIIGWAHHDSPGASGLFSSTCTATETVTATDGRQLPGGQPFVQVVDAPYFVVRRTVNGFTNSYIERMAERNFLNPSTGQPQAKYAWTVDCGLQYFGAPITVVSGLFHLIGQQVVGLADGTPVGPLTVQADGTVTLAQAASLITLGLPFTPQLQTLQLDIGQAEQTVQGKRKKIPAVTARCQETLGLSIGKSFSSLVPMKDLVLGNVGSATNQVVTDLVTADARTLIDPSWDVPGQYCFQQSNPYPTTILGVIPEITIGDK